MASFKRTDQRCAGFTLVEAVISIAILAGAMGGVIYGYVQVNYRAQWSSMSLAAQSVAAQSVERARAAKWDIHAQNPGTGPGTSDELPAPTTYIQIFTNALVVPATGRPMSVTNYVSVTSVSTDPAVRQIRADCAWRVSYTSRWYSNTIITYRISDE